MRRISNRTIKKSAPEAAKGAPRDFGVSSCDRPGQPDFAVIAGLMGKGRRSADRQDRLSEHFAFPHRLRGIIAFAPEAAE